MVANYVLKLLSWQADSGGGQPIPQQYCPGEGGVLVPINGWPWFGWSWGGTATSLLIAFYVKVMLIMLHHS